MALAPGPPLLVPVRVMNRDQRHTFSPGLQHQPGPVSCLYKPPHSRAELTALFFFWPRGRGVSGPLAHLLCTQRVRWNARATLVKLFSSRSSIFSEICLGLAVRHVPSPSSPPSIAPADLVTGTTVVSLLFCPCFSYFYYWLLLLL